MIAVKAHHQRPCAEYIIQLDSLVSLIPILRLQYTDIQTPMNIDENKCLIQLDSLVLLIPILII